ncbi:hypothetical protein STEG23_013474, partial [Scotinomys teguina]
MPSIIFLLLEIKGVSPGLAVSSMTLNSQRSKTDFYLLNARIKDHVQIIHLNNVQLFEWTCIKISNTNGYQVSENNVVAISQVQIETTMSSPHICSG